MKHRLGLLFIAIGFLELISIFGWGYMTQHHGWTNIFVTSLAGDSNLVSCVIILSPFVFIISGTIFLETGNYKLLNRKQKGLCWSCGNDIKGREPEFKCLCGQEHEPEVVRLHIEIGERQQRLRELGDE